MRMLSVLALAAALPLAASAAEDVQVQEATGQAAVLNGDKPAAREKAIDDALRQAVKMAVGMQVQSVTEVQEFQTKIDTVLEHSTGYVKRYEILKEGMDGEVVQVTVRAQVSLLALDKDLEALGLLMARKNFPRTMVLLAEQNIGMTTPARPWMRSEQVSADLRVAENVVLDELRQRGFRQLVDAEIADQKAASVGGFTTTLTAAQARKLGSLTRAEVILLGQVIVSQRAPLAELKLPDASALRLGPRARLALAAAHFERGPARRQLSVRLFFGKVWAKVTSAAGGEQRFQIETENAVAGVRGTTFRVDAQEDRSVLVRVYSGTVAVRRNAPSYARPEDGGRREVPGPEEVTRDAWEKLVGGQMQILISADGTPGVPAPFTEADEAGDDWSAWNRKRDEQAK
jgi:hypothetical protein